MKRRYGWIGILLLVCMAISTAVLYAWEDGLFAPAPEPDPLPENMTWGPVTDSSGEESEGPPASIDLTVPLIVSLDGTAYNYGVKFTVHSVSLSKTTQGLPPPISAASHIWYDTDGTLVSGHTYVLVKMSVENTTKEVRLGGVNSSSIALYNGRERLDNDPEVAITDINPEKAGRHDWFHSTPLAPGGTFHYTIGFIVKDEWLKNATDIYLAPADVNGIQQTKQPHSLQATWPADAQFILLNDYIDDWTPPESLYTPVPLPFENAVTSPFSYGDNDRFSADIMSVSANSAAPMEAVKIPQKAAEQPGITPNGTLADGYCFLRVSVQESMEQKESEYGHFFTETPVVGNEKLYVYRGDEFAGAFSPYAVWMDESMIPIGQELHAQYYNVEYDTLYTYTCIYAVPEEWMGEAYTLQMLFGGEERYDPESRAVAWTSDAVIVDLTAYLRGE